MAVQSPTDWAKPVEDPAACDMWKTYPDNDELQYPPECTRGFYKYEQYLGDTTKKNVGNIVVCHEEYNKEYGIQTDKYTELDWAFIAELSPNPDAPLIM
eukprot:404573_1